MNSKTTELQSRILDFFKQQPVIKAANGYTAQINNVKITIPKEFEDIAKQTQLKYESKSLQGLVKGVLVIKDPQGKILSQSGNITLVKFPLFTDRNTIILNGHEKFIQNQLRLRPGVYTTQLNSVGETRTEMQFSRKIGSTNAIPGIKFIYTPGKNNRAPKCDVELSSYGRNQIKMHAVDFLREVGFLDSQIMKILGNGTTADMLIKAPAAKNVTIGDIYTAMTSQKPEAGTTPDSIRNMLHDYLKDNALFSGGENIIRENLDVDDKDAKFLSQNVIGNAIKKTIDVAENRAQSDDRDNIKNQEIYSDADLIIEQIEKDYRQFESSAKTHLENDADSKSASGAKTFRPILKVGDTLNKFLGSSSVVQGVREDANVITVDSAQREVTQFFDKMTSGNVRSGNNDGNESRRELTVSGFNKIDPVEVPESQNLGLIQHLSQGAILRNKTIYNKYYPVSGGSASSDKVKELSINDAENAKIAFYNDDFISLDKKTGKLTFKKATVKARYKGEIKMMPSRDVQYIDFSPNDVLGVAGNLVPFVHHDDGTRILMACAQQKQALPLINREAPIVSSVVDRRTDETYEEKLGKDYGKPVLSGVDGVVSSIDKEKITVKSVGGKKYVYQRYYYYPFNGAYITNELTVKPGDKVKKGQMLAEGWQTKDGKLALGLNANVMYLPYKGYNYEDGIVISQSFAKRMATEDIHEIEKYIPKESKGGRGSNCLREVMTYTSDPSIAACLDKDGIIKEGTQIKAGTPLVAYLVPLQSEPSLEDLIKSADKNSKFVERIDRMNDSSFVDGKVVRVNIIDKPDAKAKQKVIITISGAQPLKTGDKLSGRHGNKGTVTKILPDNQMPIAADGTVPEVLLSPLGVPSRKNVGQLFEAEAGLIAKRTGKSEVKIQNFNDQEKNKVIAGLKTIGMPDGTVKAYLREEDDKGQIHKVQIENPVTIGNAYMLKLMHKVDDKMQARSNTETSLDKNYMPRKQTGKGIGEKHNPQGLGEMEMRALTAHGAAWNILESTTLKSDGGGDASKRVAIFKALKSQKIDPRDLNFGASPETVQTLSSNLKALGLNMQPLKNNKVVQSFNDAYDSLSLRPLNTNDFTKMLGKDKEVVRRELFDARNINSKAKTAPVKGGLLDEKIFGTYDDKDSASENRDKWGYIKLKAPVANPLFVSSQKNSGNIYSIVTGVSKKHIDSVCKGNEALIVDPASYAGFKGLSAAVKNEYVQKSRDFLAAHNLKPGDFVNVSVLNEARKDGIVVPYAAGGMAIQTLLKQVDLQKSYTAAKKELKSSVKTGDALSNQYEKVKALESLVNNNTKPEDLLLTAIPVMPSHLRPAFFAEDSASPKLINSDINKLYSNIIDTNNTMKPTVGGVDMTVALPPAELAKINAQLYKSIAQFEGVETAKDNKGNVIAPIISGSDSSSVIGGKNGLLRGNMLKKRVDFSGRSVIGVDPGLSLDEVGLPLDVAKYVYKPFIIKDLVRTGKAKNDDEAKKKWDKNDADMRNALKSIADDRPILIGRQPSLHKFGIMALKPVIKDVENGSKVRNIHLNPLVTSGFGADFDGDQMYVSTPITDKAKDEAKTIMMPSENLINPTNGEMIIKISNEMLAGLYYLSQKTPTGKVVKYSSYDSIYNDFMNGKINSNQAVSVPIAKGKTVSAGQAMINWCIPEQSADRRVFDKSWSKTEINSLMVSLYRQGEASEWKTLSMKDVGSVFDKLKTLGFNASTRAGVSISIADFTKIDNTTDMFNKREKATMKSYGNMDDEQIKRWAELQGAINKNIKAGKVLKPENNLSIMMNSGAKGSPDQVGKMIATVGVFTNIGGKLQTPVKSSYFSGLSNDEYFRQGNEARKGIFDRSVSTAKPGDLARKTWHMAQNVVITEKDCKTADYITYSKNDKSIRGRYAASAIRSSKGAIICRRNQMITDKIISQLAKDDSIQEVKVRSPLRCKTPNGCCAMCYGSSAGTLTPITVGAAVGTIAAQALGEPATQMIMKQFHTGGTGNNTAMGVERVSQILNLSQIKNNVAVISKNAGIVTAIAENKDDTVVTVGTQQYKIPKNPDGSSKVIRVQKGDIIKAGDFLTLGSASDLNKAVVANKQLDNLTLASPKDLFKDLSKLEDKNKASADVKDYISESIKHTLIGNQIDSKHAEILANRLGSNAQVLDPGDSNFYKGQYVDKNSLDRWNSSIMDGTTKHILAPIKKSESIIGRTSAKTYKQNNHIVVKKGNIITPDAYNVLSASRKISTVDLLPKPISYDPVFFGKETTVDAGESNWLSSASFENAKKALTVGASLGQVDKLNSPKTRLMTGKLINAGTGFGASPDIANGSTNNMFNFFAKPIKKKNKK